MSSKSAVPPFIAYRHLLEVVETWRSKTVPGFAPEWQTPGGSGRGVLTSNLAFRAAAQAGGNPMAVVGGLKAELDGFIAERRLPLSCQTAGPYLNLGLLEEFYPVLLSAELTRDCAPQVEERLMLEYIGANVAKRLHAGHMRNLNIGDALRRLFALGHPNLITDNHWGDWGVQFGVILWAYKQQADIDAYAASPLDELQRLYVWGNAQEGVVGGWADLVRQEFVKLEQGDAENRRLWKMFVEVSKAELARDLALFGVPPTDLEQGESFYEADMADLRQFMDQNSLWQADGEARYVDYEDIASNWVGLDQDLAGRITGFGRCYLISTNGYTTYAFRDVAARLQWARDLGVERAITVTDKTQSHNFDQAFALICYLATKPAFSERYGQATASRLTWDRLVHVGYGFLQLATGKMSTRQGNVLRLPELVDEVTSAARQAIESRNSNVSHEARDQRAHAMAIASLKWADLNRDPATDVSLDPSAITRFEGNTGTYQLYTYARLRSVLRKAGEFDTQTATAPLTPVQQELLAQMYALPAAVRQAVDLYRPNAIAAHVYAVAERANRWYVASPKILEMAHDDPARATALALIAQITEHMAFCLNLLGIETIEEL